MRPDMQFFEEDGTWVKPPGADRVTVVLKGGDSTLGHGAPLERATAYLGVQDTPRTRAEIAAGLRVSEPEADRYLGALLRADRLEVTSPHGTLHYRLMPARPRGGEAETGSSEGDGGGGVWFGYNPRLAAGPGRLADHTLRAGALPALVEVRVGEGGYALIITHLSSNEEK